MNKTRMLLGVVAVAIVSMTGFRLLRADAPLHKGYVIAEITVLDAEAYKAYAAATGPLVTKFGGTYLVRGGQTEAVEGDKPNGRVVVIEFASLAAARVFEDSPEYRAVAPLRQKSASSRIFLVEGQ